jgi:hypothetical protein
LSPCHVIVTSCSHSALASFSFLGGLQRYHSSGCAQCTIHTKKFDACSMVTTAARQSSLLGICMTAQAANVGILSAGLGLSQHMHMNKTRIIKLWNVHASCAHARPLERVKKQGMSIEAILACLCTLLQAYSAVHLRSVHTPLSGTRLSRGC